VDLLSLSAHKIYGPKGIGALYVRTGLRLSPQILGGPQETLRRAGTENLPGILGLAAAMQFAADHRDAERARLAELRLLLIQLLQVANTGAVVNGPQEGAAAHVLSVSFPGADAEMLLILLNREGFAVSLGSACNSKTFQRSHVLTALGLPRERIESTLRVSLGHPTTEDEIRLFAEAAARLVPQVREEAPEAA
jgi:cysteine desulfurase